MKRKRVLKNWVEQLLFIVFVVSFLLGISDSDMTLHFAIIHVISLLLMSLVVILLLKYGRN